MRLCREGGVVGPSLALLYRRRTRGPERRWAAQATQAGIRSCNFLVSSLFHHSFAGFSECAGQRRQAGGPWGWQSAERASPGPDLSVQAPLLSPLLLPVSGFFRAQGHPPVTSLLGAAPVASCMCQGRPLLQGVGTAVGNTGEVVLQGSWKARFPLVGPRPGKKMLLVGSLWL